MRPADSEDENDAPGQVAPPADASAIPMPQTDATEVQSPLAKALESVGSAVDSAISAAKEALQASSPSADTAADDTAALEATASTSAPAAAAGTTDDVADATPAAAPHEVNVRGRSSSGKPPPGPSKVPIEQEAAQRRSLRVAAQEDEALLATLKRNERGEPLVQIVRS